MKFELEPIEIEIPNNLITLEFQEKIVELTYEREELLKQIEDFVMTKTSIEEDILQLSKENTELKAKLEYFNMIEVKYEELNQRFVLIQKDKDCLSAQLSFYQNLENDLIESRELVNAAEEALMQKCQEIDHLVIEHANLKNEHDKSCIEIQTINKQLEEFNHQHNILNDKYNQKNHEFSVIMDERDNLINEKTTLRGQIEEIRSELESNILIYNTELASIENKFSQELSLAHQKVSERDSNINIKVTKITELQADLDYTKDRLQLLNEDIDNQRREIKNLLGQYDENERLLNTKSKEIELLRSEKNHYFSQIEQIKIDSQSLISQHSVDIIEYQEKNANIQESFFQKCNELSQMATENKILKSNFEQSVNKLEEISCQLDAKAKENDDLSCLVSEKERQYEQMSQGKNKVLEENSELRNQIVIKKEEIDNVLMKYKIDIEFLEEKHKEEILEVMKKTFAQKNVEINVLLDENEKLKSEKENDDKQINEMATKWAILQEKFNTFTHAHNEKQELLRQITCERDEFTKENKLLQGQIIDLQKEIQDDNNKYQNEIETLEFRHTEELQSLYDDRKKTFDQFEAQKDSQLEEISSTYIQKLSELQEEINHFKTLANAFQEDVKFSFITHVFIFIFI